MFWGLYAADREMVYPKYLDEFIPITLNHYWHTTVIVATLIELFLVFHRFPSNMAGICTTFAYSTAYIIWIVWVYSASKIWAYPFMDNMPVPIFPLFFSSCFFFGLGLYFGGKTLGYLIWRGMYLYSSFVYVYIFYTNQFFLNFVLLFFSRASQANG